MFNGNTNLYTFFHRCVCFLALDSGKRALMVDLFIFSFFYFFLLFLRIIIA